MAQTYAVGDTLHTAEEILGDADLRDRYMAQEHRRRYPDGCRSQGHHCEACTLRLKDTPHRYVKVGARSGYRGTWVCDEPRCPYYRSAS